MGVSRVDFDGETLVDLTGDTVTPQSLLSGYSAHNKAGEQIEGLAVIPTKVSELKNDMKYLTDTGDSSQTIVTFQEAVERANLNPGDSLAIAFGKLSKFCEDLKSVAFSGKYSDLTEKATAQDVGALPLTGGTITKGGNVPLVISNNGGNYLGVILKADSNAFGESNIRLTSEATSSEKRFMIQEVTEETKNLFQLSESNRKVYDSNSKSLKKILVEGEALLATGGKISGNTNPLLNIERTTEGGSASLKLTPGNGTKGGILLQSNYRESGNQFLVIRQNELNEILNLLVVSETQRQINDYKTGTLKEILVEGDPADSIKLPRVYSGNANYKPGKDIFEVKEFSNNSSNMPTANWYQIITMQGDDAEEKYIAQLAAGETIDALYYRNLNKNVYSKWYKVLFDGDTSHFQPGEVLNLTPNLPFAGYITGGKTQILCTIPLCKIVEGRNVKLEGKLTVRGMQEYVVRQNDISNFNVGITLTYCFIKLDIKNKDGSVFNGNNNCPLAISFEEGLKITFS